jgi:hypothetical protein
VTGEELSKTIGIYLGFLQEEHKYEAKFTIPFQMVEGFLLMSSESSSVVTSQDAQPSSQGQIKIHLEEEAGGNNNTNLKAKSPPDLSSVTTNSISTTSNGESHGDFVQQTTTTITSSASSSTASSQNKKFASNLELFGGAGVLCRVTEMTWAAGLLIQMDVTVPSTKDCDRHVLEDTFCIPCDTVPDRFVRCNIAAKIMGE